MSAITESREAVRTFVDHEHQELRTAVEWVHEVTEGMARLPVDQRSESIRRVLHWVDVDLKPHMAWEESWLFPNIEDRAMPHWATGLVRFDHRQIARKPNDFVRIAPTEIRSRRVTSRRSWPTWLVSRR